MFITFRLANSLPVEVIARWMVEHEQALKQIETIEDDAERSERQYQEQRRYFVKWDEALDGSQSGEHYLKDLRVANMLAESIHYRDDKEYRLDAFCIMSNHVHVVLLPWKKGVACSIQSRKSCTP